MIYNFSGSDFDGSPPPVRCSSGPISCRISRRWKRSRSPTPTSAFVCAPKAKGTCGAVFQAVGVALPPTVRQLEATA